MIKYTPQSQLTIEGFDTTFERKLNNKNRWVNLATLVPWDELAAEYSKNFSIESGRLSIDARLVIAAMIIKHMLKLSDRETVQMISENIYMQYFCGYASFCDHLPFDASLFVDIRKRMGNEVYETFYDNVALQVDKLQKPSKQKIKKEPQEPSDGEPNAGENRGILKIDATVADQAIEYPNDLKLLNECRQVSERLIDIMYRSLKATDGDMVKPRDYRRKARKEYLAISKKRRKSMKIIRKGIKAQLQYLKRDIKIINEMLDQFEGQPFPLRKSRDQRLLWVIQLVYEQQQQMYDESSHSIPNRIVNIYQPWVRPIVRGKDKTNVEFGSKLSISEVDGISKVDMLSWEAYNESTHLQLQVENYYKSYGCYPETLLADGIYLTRANRNWLKENNIKIVGKPLGRPRKVVLTSYQKRKKQKLANQRNHVEGKIGQGKYGYGLSYIKARRMDTTQSWINMIFAVMNLVRLIKLKKKMSSFFKNPIQIISSWIKVDCHLLINSKIPA